MRRRISYEKLLKEYDQAAKALLDMLNEVLYDRRNSKDKAEKSEQLRAKWKEKAELLNEYGMTESEKTRNCNNKFSFIPLILLAHNTPFIQVHMQYRHTGNAVTFRAFNRYCISIYGYYNKLLSQCKIMYTYTGR